MRVRIGDQVLADRTVDVVVDVVAIQGVEGDNDAVGQFVLVARMHQNPHCSGQVIDAMVVAFGKGA